MKLTDEEITLLYNRDYLVFARGIEARVHEELRKQEPVATVEVSDDGEEAELLTYKSGVLPFGIISLYAAPIPPTGETK